MTGRAGFTRLVLIGHLVPDGVDHAVTVPPRDGHQVTYCGSERTRGGGRLIVTGEAVRLANVTCGRCRRVLVAHGIARVGG